MFVSGTTSLPTPSKGGKVKLDRSYTERQLDFSQVAVPGIVLDAEEPEPELEP